MTNTITSRQMFFILLMTLTSYSIVVIAKDMAASAGTGAWLVILITAFVFGLAAMAVAKLGQMHQGQSLFEYAPKLVGKPGAYLLSLYYIAYLFFILVFLIFSLSRLLHFDFFPQSPTWSFPLIGLPVFCYVAYKGVTNVARLAEIVGIVFFITATLVHIIMAAEGDIERILPLFNAGEVGSYMKGFQYSVFPFLGIEVLLVMPFTKGAKKPIKTAFISLLIIGIFYVLIVDSSIMKLGIHSIVNYRDALIVAIRDTSPRALEIVSRLDILYLTIGFGGLFVGISIVLLVIVEYICRMLPKVKRLIVVCAVGVTAYVATFIVSGIRGYEQFTVQTGTFLGLISTIGIPFVLLIIAAVKMRKEGAKNAG